MEAPSELEAFLAGHRVEGVLDSRGEFTLSKEKALEKLASFGLPFPGAWAVKIVQASVLSGSQSGIKIDLTSKETRFFLGALDCSDLNQVEDRFFDPRGLDTDPLSHLLRGLWEVAVAQKRGFQFNLPNCDESLVWDGSQFHRVASKKRQNCFYLAVMHHSAANKSQTWIQGNLQAASVNSETQRALHQRCFVCPVPLTVDGRRVDSLQLCPSHGYGPGTFPLGLSFSEADLPQFPLPSGTFQSLESVKSAVVRGAGIEQISEAQMDRVESRESTSLACLLTGHLRQVETPKGKAWEPGMGRSTLYWISSGTVIETELLRLPQLPCSIALFLSAEGIKMDLSGFALESSPQRDSRRLRALRLAYQLLLLNRKLPTEEIIEKAKFKSKLGAGFLALLGLATTVWNPVAGMGFLGMSGLALLGGGNREAIVLAGLRDGFEHLLASLAETSR